MNKIKISYVKTIYNYLEYYWTIDDKLIVEYLDFYVNKGLCPKLKSMGTMMGLMNAWTGQLLWKPDNDFIWELIDCKQDINLPILVCEDDCDLNCIVIMVSICKTDKFVYWNKIGLLNHENEDFDKKKQSGILYLDAYTEEDWKNMEIILQLKTTIVMNIRNGFLKIGKKRLLEDIEIIQNHICNRMVIFIG